MIGNIAVGEKYPGKIREGIFLDYDNGFTLYLSLPNITSEETKGFRKGKYKFALTEKEGILFFLCEFKGAIDMSDTPFHFGLYKDDRAKNLPTISNDTEGLFLSTIVVDSATGIVKALRGIGLGTRFSKKLLEICEKQSNEKVESDEIGRKIANVQRNYHAKDLLKLSSVMCKG